jgi:hypothetical protein
MNQQPGRRRLSWAALLLALLAAFSFRTGTCAPEAHNGVQSTNIVVIDADDDNLWDDPDLTDDILGDDGVAAALDSRARRVEAGVCNRCIRTPGLRPRRSLDHGTGPDQPVRPRNQRLAESGAALLTRLGVSLT